MNKQVNQAMRELQGYITLIPKSCSVYSELCSYDCFHQKTFTVTHSKHTNDKSKVAYRVLVSQQLNEIINYKVNNAKLLINNKKICPYTVKGKFTFDAYLFNSNCQSKC
jgi:hypothetical protein